MAHNDAVSGNTTGQDGAANDPWDDHDAHLLNFLFTHGLLPSYAFPTNLCEFLVEERVRREGRHKVVAKERPQLGIAQALSEYAPGRLIVINKRTYRSGGVTASSLPTEADRATPLFANNLDTYVYCTSCSYVQDPNAGNSGTVRETRDECPLCHQPTLASQELLVPEVFTPAEGKAIDDTDRDQEYTYATAAQFPTPVGHEDLGEWRNVGPHSQVTHATDRRLVVVNKGQGDGDGFDVCEKCGAAAPTGSGQALSVRHRRPYLLEWHGPGRPPECDGAYRRVFLGTTFKSDLAVLRISFDERLATNMSSSVDRGAVEDALRTVSEALVQATSRFLDIDPAEFNAGYRIVPGRGDHVLSADIYLFDTLAGGAGYADQAGKNVRQILEAALENLEKCPKNCSRSCQDCLRHYGNQFWHEHLDRYLGALLVRYALSDELPAVNDLEAQRQLLLPLRRMLELDGFACESGTTINGVDVPLIVRSKGGGVAIATHSGLLNRELVQHPVAEALDAQDELNVRILNAFLVDRNLPAAYQVIRSMLRA